MTIYYLSPPTLHGERPRCCGDLSPLLMQRATTKPDILRKYSFWGKRIRLIELKNHIAEMYNNWYNILYKIKDEE